MNFPYTTLETERKRKREGDGEKQKEREPRMLHTWYFKDVLFKAVFLSIRPKC